MLWFGYRMQTSKRLWILTIKSNKTSRHSFSIVRVFVSVLFSPYFIISSRSLVLAYHLWIRTRLLCNIYFFSFFHRQPIQFEAPQPNWWCVYANEKHAIPNCSLSWHIQSQSCYVQCTFTKAFHFPVLIFCFDSIRFSLHIGIRFSFVYVSQKSIMSWMLMSMLNQKKNQTKYGWQTILKHSRCNTNQSDLPSKRYCESVVYLIRS